MIPDERKTLPPELRSFLRISITLAILCFACELSLHYFFGIPSSIHRGNIAYTWPTLWWNDWRDFTCWMPRFRHMHTMDFFSTDPDLDQLFMYPAPGALLFKAFYSIPFPLASFLLLTTLVMLAIVVLFYGAVRRAGLAAKPAVLFVVLAFAFSYPLWFEFDLANMEIWMMFFVLGGSWAFLTDRPYVAATFFAIATGCKIFPFIFFSLFLTQRRYRPIVYGAGLLIVLELAGLWAIYPDFHVAAKGVAAGLDSYRVTYFLPDHFETGFDHSLFGVIKVVADLCLGTFGSHSEFPPPSAFVLKAAGLYLPVIACVGIMLYFVYIRKLPVSNQILAFTVIAILFPPVSHDYTLLHLYTPWAMLVLLAIRHRQALPGLGAAMVCMSICMAPETEFILRNQSIGGQIKCVALVVLLVISLRYRFPDVSAVHFGSPATQRIA